MDSDIGTFSSEMNLHIGTMGFSYIDWNGVFYPSEMSAKNYLAYYSRIFNSVEIDSTFYGTPKAEVVNRWKHVTPDNFMICVKMPRVVTHEMGLIDTEGLAHEFLERMGLLGRKLGVILIQFPPSFKSSQINNIADYLSALPSGYRFAIEIRHQSWYTARQDFSDLLRANNICWAATEHPRMPSEIIKTTDWLYIRWIGQHGTYMRFNHERVGQTNNLQMWWEQIIKNSDLVNELFGFFNNDYSGFAVATANRFKKIIGLPVNRLEPPQQGRLF